MDPSDTRQDPTICVTRERHTAPRVIGLERTPTERGLHTRDLQARPTPKSTQVRCRSSPAGLGPSRRAARPDSGTDPGGRVDSILTMSDTSSLRASRIAVIPPLWDQRADQAPTRAPRPPPHLQLVSRTGSSRTCGSEGSTERAARRPDKAAVAMPVFCDLRKCWTDGGSVGTPSPTRDG